MESWRCTLQSPVTWIELLTIFVAREVLKQPWHYTVQLICIVSILVALVAVSAKILDTDEDGDPDDGAVL